VHVRCVYVRAFVRACGCGCVILLEYHIEGNFGEGKIWRLTEIIAVGEIKFGEC